MSDNNKNKKILLTDFIRYRKDEMSERERNSFERELQKDPFAEEATEGLSSLSEAEISNDMDRLQKSLRSGTGRRQKYIFYRIAASVAVLMVISSVFIVLNRKIPEKQLSEKTIPSEIQKKTEEQPVTPAAVKEVLPEVAAVVRENKSQRSSDLKRKPEKQPDAGKSEEIITARSNDTNYTGRISARPAEIIVSEERMAAPMAAMTMTKTVSEIMYKGKVTASDDNMPVPGASVNIKGTNKGVVTDASGNFSIAIPEPEKTTLVASFIGMETKEFQAKTDSVNLIRLDPSVLSLSEIVVVGYGTRKAESGYEAVQTGYESPQPVNGRSDFDKYIRDNIHRPDTLTAGQRVVVVVSFQVNTAGNIDSIKIVRSPGKPFSDEAIRLIKTGPSWKPAEENGKPVEDEVRIRIIFR
jgi:TonB family protein